MLDKTYNPAEAEARQYARWEEAGAFACAHTKGAPRPGQRAFTIIIPPPNVTGSLHMGHALNNTLQDILVRYERMRGRDVLWQPGTDHAGIATQMVVERQLAAENTTRQEMGREAFIDASGSGRPNRAAPSSASFAGSAPRATGRASASPWTTGCRPRCAGCSSRSIARG